MNIETLHWDPVLTRAFSINPEMLPEIRSSSEIIGLINDETVLSGIPISGVSIYCLLIFSGVFPSIYHSLQIQLEI